MNEPVNDYYVTQMVQDLENDLYDSKERIQRLRRQNDELAVENERLRDGIEVIRDPLCNSCRKCTNDGNEHSCP